MKLIDLLVQELPKRGGWPDGRIHAWQDESGEIRFDTIIGHDFFPQEKVLCENRRPKYTIKVSSSDSFVVTRYQYESALAESQKVEWSGDGLPPVGCECEARYREVDGAEWFFFRCVGVDCGVAFGWAGKEAVAIGKGSYEFRPLRTEADKKRDAAAKEMARHANDDENRMFDAGLRNCLSIYDAIAAGKIPGVKLDD